MSKWLLVMFMCVMVTCSSIRAFAQEEERVEYSWGTVKSISSNQIVILEYDYDRDEDVESAYSINPNVEFRGVETLKDIAVGDDIDIEYVIQSGKKITKVITAEKSFGAEEQEEYVPSETYEEEWEYPREESGPTEPSEPKFE